MPRGLIQPAPWQRYAAALVLFAVALGVGRVAFAAESALPFITLFPVVALAAVFCGLGPAILGMLLSGAALAYEPDGSSVPSLVTFFASASVVCGVVGWMRRAHTNAVAALEETRAVPRDTAAGEQRRAEASLHEIQAALAALRASEERLELFIEHAPAAIAVFDRDMRYIAVSRRFAEDLRVDGSQLIGRRHYDIFPEIPQRWRDIHRRCLAGATERCAEDPFPRPDGTMDWIAWEIRPWRDVAGQVGGIILYSEVITWRKQTEDALREAKAKAERANLAKSKFLATASHDLRQPVQSLVLFLDLVKNQATAELERPLYFMEQAVTALNVMLNGILDISRLDAGVLSPTNEVFDAGALLRRLGDDYAAEAALRSLRLRIQAPSMGVWADIVLVERILRNLIDNALRYTEAGGLVVGCRRHGDEVRIDVVDSGVGIAEEHLPSVFEEYYQVDNDARDRAKGLGLGLAIVDRLVALVGGRLELRSRLGCGSRFSVFLPAVALPPTASAGPTAEVGGKLVLVIEDEEMVRMGLRAMMESWGFHVVDAADPASALRLAIGLDRRPDAILADYRLRDGQTGVDAARQIRAALGADIPTMVLTGDTAGEPIHQVQASGFGILHKPVPAEALRAAVTRLLSRGQSR